MACEYGLENVLNKFYIIFWKKRLYSYIPCSEGLDPDPVSITGGTATPIDTQWLKIWNQLELYMITISTYHVFEVQAVSGVDHEQQDVLENVSVYESDKF